MWDQAPDDDIDDVLSTMTSAETRVFWEEVRPDVDAREYRLQGMLIIHLTHRPTDVEVKHVCPEVCQDCFRRALRELARRIVRHRR
jgi:hypothetical protein